MHSRGGCGMISLMAAIAGRARRPRTGPNELIQGRIRPDLKERARRGAAVRGISLAMYLELLIEQDELADECVASEPAEQLDIDQRAS